MAQEINATIRGKQSNVPYEKKTVVLGGNMVGERNILTQDMLLSEDTKYIIRWAFDLDAKTVIMPAGSSLEFNGGSMNNGTIVLNDTPVYPSYSNLTSGSHLTIEGNPSVGTYNYTDGMPVWWNGSEWKRGADLSEEVEQMQEDIEKLQINLENFNPASSRPIVVPVADEEDITVDESTNTHKFKDKEYDPANYSGLGRVYLRKNITQIPKTSLANGSWLSYQAGTYLYLLYWYNGTLYNCHKTGSYGLVIGAGQVAEEIANYSVDLLPDYAQGNSLEYTITNNLITITLPDETTIAGSSIHDVTVYEYWENVDEINLLTQEMVSEENTIYIIQYDYILESDITVPANCVLQFEGGSISGDGTDKDTITGDNTIISSEPKRIFSGIILTGSFGETKFYLDYFANSTDNSLNYIEAVKSTVNINEYAPIHLANRVYNFSSQIDLNEVFVDRAHITLYGEGKGSIINILYGSPTYGGNIDNADYLFIRDVTGHGWQNLVTITLSNLHITTPDTDSNRGFFHTPTAWTNDTYIIGVTTKNLACVFNVYRAYWFRMNQCTLYGGHTQLRVYDCNSSSITNCQFRATSQVDGIAIHCTGAHGFNIMGNDFSQHHIAMKFDGDLNENVTIIGNYIEVGSKTQQNHELILNDADTTQLCNHFVISNNAGLHHTKYFDNSEYKQYYGTVCNGRVANSSFDCAIGEWNAKGYNNIGKIYLDESVDESLIKKYFVAYSTMCSYTIAASKSSDMFWDNRELEKRVTQLLLNQKNIISALKQANISVSPKTEFEEDGKIVVDNDITSQFYFRSNHANVKKIFGLSIGSTINGGALFTNLKKLEYVASFDCSNLTTMRSTFSQTNIVEAPYLNTGHITDFTAMFDQCFKLKYIPNYDLSSATDITHMFRSCISLKSLPVLDLTNVENATNTFSTCEQLEDIGGLQNLSVSFHLRESKFITKESVINIANSIYDWATNPSGKTAPSSTPTITFNSIVYNTIDNDTKALFTNKGWAIAST